MRRMSLAIVVLALAVSATSSLAQSQDPVIASARQLSQHGNYDTAIQVLRTGLASRPSDEALKQELASVLDMKASLLAREVTELRREIRELRGVSTPTWTYTPSAARPAVAPGAVTVPKCVAVASPNAAPVRVGGDIRVPMKVQDRKPAYPAEAMRDRIEGIVILEATVDCDGTVADAKVLRGTPALNDAALGAVREWRYTPTLLNGQPVPVIMTVTVTFSLR